MTSTILDRSGQPVRCVDLEGLVGRDLPRFPWLMRILIENVARHAGADGRADAVAPFLDWLRARRSDAEIAFRPGRVLMHDTTCTPALVDIAAMRDAIAEAGRDPARLNPVLPVDVSVDHSVAVDAFAGRNALATNMAREYARNAERYRFMKWATRALADFRVHPPGSGIMHTINLERLATVVERVEIGGEAWAVPDTMIGTDSHTPMINGIGVLGLGVGGLEAESVMFGTPVMMRIPEVIGVRLDGRLGEGVLATDLALTVTALLRALGMAGEFVEFFGPGVASLSAGERAVVANMAPEYGAASGYFPIDERTLHYLRATGRSVAQIDFVERYARATGLWFDPAAVPDYTRVVEVDLGAVETSLAGPRRPQDRLSPAEVPGALAALPAARGGRSELPRHPVAIAAITSCTNTSERRLLVAAGLLARKARRLGLSVPAWVKTSLAPGSPTTERHLRRTGLLDDLEALGFGIVGYGCTTCIGNSGPLVPAMEAAVAGGAVMPVAILSGNRNFPGRVHPQIEAGFLASPPLVIAYALAGDADRDVSRDPLGETTAGQPVRLAELWPSGSEIDAVLADGADEADFRVAYDAAATSESWEALDAPATVLFPWGARSTYLRPPPFAGARQPSRVGHYSAHPLLVLGDDITTDHVSPAGPIPAHSPAGAWLLERDERAGELNVYAARRGNWEVMLRGLFANRSVVNLLGAGIPPGSTVHAPSGEVMPLWLAAERYRADGLSTVILAGERYGAGSSRDWAAKGLALLGVRAVLAVSFERIHRANLIGMGILPLELPKGDTPAAFRLTPKDLIEIDASPERVAPHAPIPVTIRYDAGGRRSLTATAAVHTALERATLLDGGAISRLLSQHLLEPGPDALPAERPRPTFVQA